MLNKSFICQLLQATKIVSLVLTMLFSSLIYASNQPPKQQDRSIDANHRDAVIERFINELKASYIFPKKVESFEQAMHAFKTTSEYQQITSSISLASKVNQILANQIGDGHLFFGYSERALPIVDSNESIRAKEKQRELDFMRSLNWGIEKVQRFPFNIGYIDVSMFADTAHAEETIAAAMSLVANTEALIIDLRFSRGGDPQTVALLASYFLDKPTHLSDIYDRKEQKTTRIESRDSVKGKHYGEKRSLYILTSQDTYSAAEDFAYTLKHLNRAQIVGDVTGGGAHPGEFFRLASHFEAFIPTARSINAVTGGNWEGKGVIPNIKVNSSVALTTAQTKILEMRLLLENDPRRKERMKARIAKIKSSDIEQIQ